jgi:tricorn protease-like protein
MKGCTTTNSRSCFLPVPAVSATRRATQCLSLHRRSNLRSALQALALIVAVTSAPASGRSLNTNPPSRYEPEPATTYANSEIWFIAVSPEGKTVASGNLDGVIRLWDISSGKELLTIKGHNGHVRGIAFSPGGKMIVSGSSDRTVKIWDASTGKEIRTISDPNMTGHMALSLDGRWVAVAGKYPTPHISTVKLWDLATGAELRAIGALADGDLIGNYNDIKLTFSPNGKTLATSRAYYQQGYDRENAIQIWEVSTGRELGRIGIRYVTNMAFRPDGKMLAAASADEMVYVWDLVTGALQKPLKGHGTSVRSVAFSPDGSVLASGAGYNGFYPFAFLWDVNSGSEIRQLKGHTVGVYSLAFTPDGKMLLTGGGDGTIKVWSMSGGHLLRTMAPNSGLIIP